MAEQFSLKNISDLKDSPYNPRSISKEALAALRESLGEFGDISGIVFNTQTGHLVCGHQRMKALRSQYGEHLVLDGETLKAPDGQTFSVRIVDWPEIKEMAANVAANSQYIQGEFTDGLSGVIDKLSSEAPQLMEKFRFDEFINESLDSPTISKTKLDKSHKQVWILIGIPADKYDKFAEILSSLEKEDGVTYDTSLH